MNGFNFLVRSIGGVTTCRSRIPNYEHNGKKLKGNISYRVTPKFNDSMEPFSLPRKLSRYIPKTKYPPSRRISSVVGLHEAECVCISVDAEDGLYVTDDFIVTHNTFTSSEIIKNIGGVVCAAAPTGKARVRLAEALQENGVTKISRIGTIHSLLGVDYKSEGFDYTNPSFVYNSTNPLNCDCLVLDEFGNTPTFLTAAALRAIPSDARVLFIGDPDQLAPVGHGKPLIDMIGAGIPHAKLGEVHRYAGRIAHVCKQINNGKSPVFTPHDSIDWRKKECPENCIFIESSHNWIVTGKR